MNIPNIGVHENVMLIAMSTLPPRPQYNTYRIQEGNDEWCFKGIAQMEAHTKYVICKLAASNNVLDRIVILESEKARTQKPANWEGETATSFFKKRIKGFFDDSEFNPFHIEDTLDSLVETKPENIGTDKKNHPVSKPEIITVDLEDPVYFWKAVNVILGRSEIPTEDSSSGKSMNHKVLNDNIDLYMDMQGGDRNTISQMNAIVELLSRQGVTVKGRYANDFIPNRTPPLHTIREASEEYRTYDLISAMDAFTRYGWGDSLDEFFRGRVRGSSKESKLIKAIKQASSAISKCNADGFDSAVQKIEKLKSEFKESEQVTQMDVVFQDIQDDYAPLFGAKYRYVAQIRWCLDKKFLQQALTIFEAKMPHEFILSGLLYYKTSAATEEDRDNFLKKCEQIYQGLHRKDRYRMKDLNHYLIKDYCNGYDRSSGNSFFEDPENLLHFGLGDERKDEVIGLIDKYRNLCGLRNQMNHAIAGNHNQNGFYQFMKSRHPNDRMWKDRTGANYEQLIRDYLDEWESLADDNALFDLRGKILDLS